MKHIKTLTMAFLAIIMVGIGFGSNDKAQAEDYDLGGISEDFDYDISKVHYGTKTDSVQLNSYNFGDVEKSVTLNMMKGSLKVAMPKMGTYSFKADSPEVRIKLIHNFTGKTVSSKTYKGVNNMDSTHTFNLNVPFGGKYHVKITGNIDQAKSHNWYYTTTFR